MKKISAIILLSVYLCATTHVTELFKLPALFEHYTMERNWYPEATFWQFLVKHYTDDTSNDADYAEDMKLPFKTCNNSNLCLTSFYPINPVFKLVKRENIVQPVRRPVTGDFFYSSAYLSNIWQPPKGC